MAKQFDQQFDTVTMTAPPTDVKRPRRVSKMAEEMAGSQILKIAGDVRALVAKGRQICNFTVGDFAPKEFGIPEVLRDGITNALAKGETNYPPGAGLPVLREAIQAYMKEWMGLDYSATDSILAMCGARPGIYSAYRTLVDPGDRVVYSAPSWQNPYYCQLVGAEDCGVLCDASTNFLPTRAMLEPHIKGARMLVLNSPLNPTGTMFDGVTLGEICDLVLEENARRESHGERPLYLLYDQVYWMLALGETKHVTPVALRPALKPYTIAVDAISKSFAATGVRVGWVVGPPDLIRVMTDFVGHVGAWAPRAEQIATADLLRSKPAITAYHGTMKRGLRERLDALYHGIMAMRERGLPVDAIPPMGAIYLSVRFVLEGARMSSGQVLAGNEALRRFLLEEADCAVVPFQAFGVPDETGWFRFSVGAVSMADIEAVLPKMSAAIERLSVGSKVVAGAG